MQGKYSTHCIIFLARVPVVFEFCGFQVVSLRSRSARSPDILTSSWGRCQYTGLSPPFCCDLENIPALPWPQFPPLGSVKLFETSQRQKS